VARRRYDGVISTLLALLLVAQVMAIAVAHSKHTVDTVRQNKQVIQVEQPGSTVTTPKAKPRQPKKHHAASKGSIPLPSQPVAPAAQGSKPTNTGIASRPFTLTPRLRAMVPASTVLVHLVKNTKGYSSATAKKPDQTIPAAWYGYYSVLPVIATGNFRLEVRLPRRPNESTTWVKATSVQYSRTNYAILVDLSHRRLVKFYNGQETGSYPVGIGASDDPTPTGSYFVAFRSPPPDPSYGPFVLATSDHSDTFQGFDGQNDAIIAIHGPIDAAGSIGSTGAAISHGCIRMLDPDLSQLGNIPTGTPVIITY
jgi:lipoprotein-anchoring transpeptidase ErfK/SrfK